MPWRLVLVIMALAFSHNELFGQPTDSKGLQSVSPPAESSQVSAKLTDSADEQEPAAVSPDDFEELKERLATVEKEWQAQKDSLREAEDEAASKPTLEIGGRIHADYWAFPYTSPGIGFFEHPLPADPRFGQDPEDFFGFRRVRLELEGDLLEQAFWRTQVDFNTFSLPEAKDVFVGFRNLPCNQRLLIGNQKRPLGLDHLNSSNNNVFMERPLVVDAFNEDARRPGMAFYGSSRDEAMGWAYGTYLLKNITLDGRYRGDSYNASLNGRLFSSPWYARDGRDYYHCAVSAMLAHPAGNQAAIGDGNDARFRTRPEARSELRWFDTGRIADADYFETLGVESMLNIGPIQVTGEYQATWLQRMAGSGLPDLFFHGLYVFAAWNLTGESIPYSRSTGTIGRLIPSENFLLMKRGRGRCAGGCGAWQLAARYDYIDLSDNDISGGIGHAWTIALNWFLSPFTKFQTNFIYGNMDARGPIGGFSAGDYFITGTRLAVAF